MPSTPKARIEAEGRARGRAEVVAGCVRLLEGRFAEVDDALITVLGGEAAHQVLDGREGGEAGYWPRVWAARGLLHAWDDSATAALLHAARDASWRVREMTARVAARHHVAAAFDAMAALRSDPVPRVRAAADRALAALAAARA